MINFIFNYNQFPLKIKTLVLLLFINVSTCILSVSFFSVAYVLLNGVLEGRFVGRPEVLIAWLHLDVRCV